MQTPYVPTVFFCFCFRCRWSWTLDTWLPCCPTLGSWFSTTRPWWLVGAMGLPPSFFVAFFLRILMFNQWIWEILQIDRPIFSHTLDVWMPTSTMAHMDSGSAQILVHVYTSGTGLFMTFLSFWGLLCWSSWVKPEPNRPILVVRRIPPFSLGNTQCFVWLCVLRSPRTKPWLLAWDRFYFGRPLTVHWNNIDVNMDKRFFHAQGEMMCK